MDPRSWFTADWTNSLFAGSKSDGQRSPNDTVFLRMDEIPYIHEDRPESYGENGESQSVHYIISCLPNDDDFVKATDSRWIKINVPVINKKVYKKQSPAIKSLLQAVYIYTFSLFIFSTVSLFSSLSDVPTESQPCTSPFISSLSLSSSEENIGKKLLRKLSE